MVAGSVQQQVSYFKTWSGSLTPEQWAGYREVLRAFGEADIPFAVGGGLAAMAYADQFRGAHDLDLYIEHASAPQAIAVLQNAGFADFFDDQPYDRKWIYRSRRCGTVLDLMWAMANQRSVVDRSWLLGPVIRLDGLALRLLPPEETLWTKLYVLQRDRCDWPDALSMLSVVGPTLDWKHLIERLEDDSSLLSALLCAYRWLCPDTARLLPPWLWDHLQLSRPAGAEDADCNMRADLLDSRPWFTPTLDGEQRTGPGEDISC